MKRERPVISLGILILVLLAGCRQPEEKTTFNGTSLQHYCVDQLTNAIVYDIFSPPVASRIYSYANLAYYEALRPGYPGAGSIIEKMHGFGTLNAPAREAHEYRLAGAIAFMKVAQKLVFSRDSLILAEKKIIDAFRHLDNQVLENSTRWGESVAAVILERASKDNYSITRSMPKFSVFNQEGIWKQTPPDYADATEPHWKRIRPLRMDSASQCSPTPPPAYSLDSSSQYYRELMEVYATSQKISGDNPFVTEHRGHLTYANKKITPVGHWMGITRILCVQAKKDDLATAEAYALTSSAIFDGFISCWDEKFRSQTVRPITVIREHISPEWNSLLQTPPFPEYTSGHSVISAAASTVLTRIFGEGFAFHDSSELEYLGLERSFPSIEAAADEAGISRLYGGIHYRSAIDNGKKQGMQVGLLYTALIR
jgi:hypothetical protein